MNKLLDLAKKGSGPSKDVNTLHFKHIHLSLQILKCKLIDFTYYTERIQPKERERVDLSL